MCQMTNPVRDIPLQALSRAELERLFVSRGLKAHQARLAFQNLHRRGARKLDEFSGLSAAALRFLESLPALPELQLESLVRSADGTLKLRIGIPARAANAAGVPNSASSATTATVALTSIEAVIIPSPKRVTLCVSSQAGCAAACSFCHTGTMGLWRNLEAWEIVEQHRLASRVWAREGGGFARDNGISNIVFMGMGEPLHNEEQVVRACEILGDAHGAAFPVRRLVVSTAGVGARIRPFWERGVGALAVSLHATTDALRDQLVPMNRQCNLSQLRQILLEIPWRNRESLTVAYLLLEDVNDSREDARRLADWTAGLPAKINLLEFNAFPGSQFKRASAERLTRFRRWLDERGAFHTLRQSRGSDAMAACGQLAGKGRAEGVKG